MAQIDQVLPNKGSQQGTGDGDRVGPLAQKQVGGLVTRCNAATCFFLRKPMHLR